MITKVVKYTNEKIEKQLMELGYLVSSADNVTISATIFRTKNKETAYITITEDRIDSIVVENTDSNGG